MPRELQKRTKHLQVAVDFLASYGLAILIMLVAISVAYIISQQTSYLFASQCIPTPSFSCGYFAISQRGILTVGLSQSTGAEIVVHGVACSTGFTQNSMPAYGNIYVTSNSVYYSQFSPISPSGVVIPSGGTSNFNVYCYGPSGVAYSNVSGSTFVGYIWLNYTIQNTNIKTVQQVASLGLEYTGLSCISCTLTVTASPSSAGSTSGTGSYLFGNIVTISATPIGANAFVRWTCTGSGCYSGTNSIANILITGSITETADFSSGTFLLTTSASPSADGSVSPPSGNYLAGNSVTITATPNAGYSLSSWSCTGSGCYSGSSPSANIVISGVMSETANFNANTYTLTTSASPSADGSVSPLTGNYLYGNTVTITATANNGYALSSWSCTGSSCYSGSNTVANIVISGAMTETANFQQQATTVFNPTSGSYGPFNNIEYNTNTGLSGDIFTSTGNIKIDGGVTLTTNGHSLVAGGVFNNLGTVTTGYPNNYGVSDSGSAGGNYGSSYAGSGGGGGGGGGTSGGGSTPGAPSMSNANIASWYSGGFVNYVSAAGGGGGCSGGGWGGQGGATLASGGAAGGGSFNPCSCGNSGNNGGSGAYGVYIQANQIIAGTISASGQGGAGGACDGGGGGGGGVIMLAYGNGGYTSGSYSYGGGGGAQDGAGGGGGQLATYSYGASPPLTP